MSQLKVKVLFKSENHGGRQNLPLKLLSSREYRPHVVVDLESAYLGVCFIGQEGDLVVQEKCIATIDLIYNDVDYSSLISGTEFKILEGEKVVGSGVVM